MCWMRVWASVSGSAVGVLRITAVEAIASSACSPSGVRLPRSWERMRSSASFRTTYHCEQWCSVVSNLSRPSLLIPRLAPSMPLFLRALKLLAPHLPFRSPLTAHVALSTSLRSAQTWVLFVHCTCTTAMSRYAPSPVLARAADALSTVRRGLKG